MNLTQALIERGMEEDEIKVLISDAKDDLYARLEDGEMPMDICEEWFGLEPDYLVDLIGELNEA